MKIALRTIAFGAIVLLLGYLPSPMLAQQSPPRFGPGFGGRRPGPSDAERERARIRIGITKEQQQQLEAILGETGKASREVMDQLREKQKELLELYEAYDIDTKKERALIREIAQLRVRLMEIHSQHEAKVRKVLTREQHAKLRALMREMMEEMTKRRRPGPPPPPSEGKPN